ncbi:MAG: DUF4178 domain-containing protein [Myxococcota bacterium]|jgi:hypothetical protein|nr:DUF4178 domain-containing protein [Myxococcota bacterium]
MDLLLIAVLAVVLGLGAFVTLRVRGQGKKAPLALAREPTLGTLKPDDVVIHFERDYVVASVELFDEHGQRWTHCHLQGGESAELLRVEPGDELQAVMLRRCAELPFSEPPPEQLQRGDERFGLTHWGKAKVQRSGSDEALCCRQFRYESAMQKVLLVLVWEGAQREFWCGEVVPVGSLEFLPGA